MEHTSSMGNGSGMGKNSDLALLFFRIGVGLIFILAGWGKLNGIEGVQGFFGSVGIPMAGILAWVVALTEFVGGLMVLTGFRIRIPGLLLAIVMLVAVVMVQMSQGWNAMRLELLLLLVSLGLSMTGSGAYSLDHVLAGRKSASPASA